VKCLSRANTVSWGERQGSYSLEVAITSRSRQMSAALARTVSDIHPRCTCPWTILVRVRTRLGTLATLAEWGGECVHGLVGVPGEALVRYQGVVPNSEDEEHRSSFD
jgi:hypothetical protein